MFLKQQGVRAILRDSANPYNLMRMSNASDGDYGPGLLPTGFLAHEDYSLLWRVLKRGSVRIELEITNSFSAGPVTTSNTVAEIRGVEKSDETIILGAHLDSWDLASGSTDNGTGVVVVLEAARALAKLGLKPKRTIRFVLFTGEEQGEVGSRHYVEMHRDELPKISAILVDDNGTSRVVTVGIHENFADIESIVRILAPLSGPLKLLEPKLSRTFGSDYAAFNEAGVPGFSCIGDWPEYAETQHTQSDTFDKVSKDGITQAAQLMAGWAFNTAQYSSLLERGPKK
jgi:carboxypeptidase Q